MVFSPNRFKSTTTSAKESAYWEVIPATGLHLKHVDKQRHNSYFFLFQFSFRYFSLANNSTAFIIASSGVMVWVIPVTNLTSSIILLKKADVVRTGRLFSRQKVRIFFTGLATDAIPFTAEFTFLAANAPVSLSISAS